MIFPLPAGKKPRSPVDKAKRVLAKREREARSQYARDIAEAGKAHGIEIRLKTRPDGEVVLLDPIPEKVPFGMLLSLVALRRHWHCVEGRIEIAHGILARVQEGAEMGWAEDVDGIDEDNAEAFQQYADAILDANHASRVEVDLVL